MQRAGLAHQRAGLHPVSCLWLGFRLKKGIGKLVWLANTEKVKTRCLVLQVSIDLFNIQPIQ